MQTKNLKIRENGNGNSASATAPGLARKLEIVLDEDVFFPVMIEALPRKGIIPTHVVRAISPDVDRDGAA
jgi:hypothetical protein